MIEFLTSTRDVITENREWVFGGIGTALLGWLGVLINPFKKKNASQTQNNTNTNTNQVTINNNIGSTGNDSNDSETKVCKHTPEERKKLTKILFIDDEKFEVVAILKKAGWVNVKNKKKVNGPDDPEIINADICFVDIFGVATDLYEKDQGLGLVGAIKDRHPEKKVVVYSSQEQGEVFNELWGKADARLSKNAEPYQFENLLENFSEEIYC